MSAVVIIAGPTAVGKTDLTVALAKHYQTEIISCDSMQIYQQMAIGSAKPSPLEMAGIKHHLMDFVDPLKGYSVSDYARDAREVIALLHQRQLLPLVTGGTGLYINSLIYQMDFCEAKPDPAYREALVQQLEVEGLEGLYHKLSEIAPQKAKSIHPNNVHKILRALEIAHAGDISKDFSKDLKLETAYEPLLIVLTRNRDELYDRINKRVDQMLDQGLLEEVRALVNLGLTPDHQAMKGIGYKEVIAHLKGEYDYQTMVSQLKQNTRRYAKRQLTWFRRYEQAIWLNLSEIPVVNDQFSAIIKEIERRHGCVGNENPPNQQRTL